MRRNIKSKTKESRTPSNVAYLQRKDYWDCFLSFALDVSVMLSPMMLWNLILLAVLGSLLSVTAIFIANIIVGVLMGLSIFFFNSSIIKKTKGRTFGMYQFGFAIMRENGKRASQKVCLMHEVLGNAIPFVVLMIFTNVIGVFVYWALNGIIFLVDKKHRNLIDFLLRTYLIRVEAETIESKQEVKAPVTEKKVESVSKVSYPRNHIDLRVRSNFSANGEYNVEEIFQMAAKEGIHTISITDWNSVKANALAVNMSKLYNINYVPGIEIGAEYKGRRVRVLGYFIDYKNDIFTTIENNGLVNERNASLERVRRFEKILGVQIPVERLLHTNRFQRISGRLLVRHVLNSSLYDECEVLKPYRKMEMNKAVEIICQEYFAYGKPCYVMMKCPPLQDVLDVISLTNGVAVLADGADFLHDEELMKDILSHGIEGIEVFQSAYNKKQMADLLRYAQKDKLLITCGSGFTSRKQGNELGDCHCPEEAESLIISLIRAKM